MVHNIAFAVEENGNIGVALERNIEETKKRRGEKMSNLVKHAKRELEAVGMFDEDSDYNGMIGTAVMELIELFSKQGHSGMSASIVRSLFDKVADYKPLSPITCEPKEWNNDNYQNNRLSSVFKDGKDGKPYYLDAIVFRGQHGGCFTGNSVKLKNGETIQSRQFIKLPFIPKTFYIDVIETEWADKDETIKKEGGGWWTSVVKDESQLKEVFEYYLKPIK